MGGWAWVGGWVGVHRVGGWVGGFVGGVGLLGCWVGGGTRVGFSLSGLVVGELMDWWVPPIKSCQTEKSKRNYTSECVTKLISEPTS